jgi:hypothetical protein
MHSFHILSDAYGYVVMLGCGNVTLMIVGETKIDIWLRSVYNIWILCTKISIGSIMICSWPQCYKLLPVSICATKLSFSRKIGLQNSYFAFLVKSELLYIDFISFWLVAFSTTKYAPLQRESPLLLLYLLHSHFEHKQICHLTLPKSTNQSHDHILNIDCTLSTSNHLISITFCLWGKTNKLKIIPQRVFLSRSERELWKSIRQSCDRWQKIPKQTADRICLTDSGSKLLLEWLCRARTMLL